MTILLSQANAVQEHLEQKKLPYGTHPWALIAISGEFFRVAFRATDRQNAEGYQSLFKDNNSSSEYQLIYDPSGLFDNTGAIGRVGELSQPALQMIGRSKTQLSK
jgi:hypothetical protein